MLYIFCSFIVLFPTFWGIGLILEKIFKASNALVSFRLIFGIMGITLSWTLISFFTNLSLGIEISTIVLGWISFLKFQGFLQTKNLVKENKFSFSVIFLLILFSGSYYPFILDHFGYYVPTIKWITEFGLVKGISNLDLTLGQMSFWHIFQAGFSHFADPFLRINTVILVIYLLYIFEKKSWTHLLFLPILFLFTQSPSTDLPVIILGLMVLDEILSGKKNIAALWSISIFAFAIKPTMIWLPVFVFLYAMLNKTAWKSYIVGSCIILIFIVKNLWCFGFPIFPVQVFDIGLAWKPNSYLLQKSSEMAIRKTFDMQYTYAQVQQFSPFEYLKNWLFLKGIKSWIHLSFIVLLAVLLWQTFRSQKKIMWLLCISIVLKSVLVLLFSAQYRFFLEVFFVIAFVFFSNKISKKQALYFFSAGSILFIFLFSFPKELTKIVPSFKPGSFMTGFQSDQFEKPSYFLWNKYHTYTLGNLKFNVVQDYPFSFDAPIPSITPEYLEQDLQSGIFPQKRTHDLKGGFYWRKMTDSEKKQLQKILKDNKYTEVPQN